MSNSPTYKVSFRRRRESKTNYVKRLSFLKSGKARVVVRKTNNSTIVEVVSYDPKGDSVVSFFTSISLRKLGWKGHTGNIPSAYLAGYACAKQALKKGTKEAVLDIGLFSPVHGSRVFSALKGAIDAGLSIPADAVVFPKDDRLTGKHIGEEVAKNFDETKKTLDKEFG